MKHFQLFIDALWQLSLEAAPWLLLGLIIGGLFKSLIPTALLHKHLTKPGLGAITKAALLGMPLPLCSCGVIPAAIGLRQAGASKPATTSFLVSTPETGVDSIGVTYAMMGPVMAVIRPIAAVFSALVTGLLVLFFDHGDKPPVPVKKSSCCASQKNNLETTDKQTRSLKDAVTGVKYALTDLYQDILKWLVIGLLFAAAVQAFVPQDWLLHWGDSWMAMLVMLFVGIPMYVCATGSTPIAAGFLMAGISPGAVLIYLLAGPATNMATLGVVREQMGGRTMWLYLLGIISSALLMGVLVNILSSYIAFNTMNHEVHEMLPFLLEFLCLLVLIILAIKPLVWQDKKDSCCE